MQNLGEDLRVDTIVNPQAVGVGTVNTITGGYKSMAKYRKGMVIITATLADTKTCIAQLTCSSAASATNKKDVSGKTITLTGAAATSLFRTGIITFDVNDLIATDSSNIFVGCDLTNNNAPDVAGAVLVRGAGRYMLGGANATTGAQNMPA